MSGPTGLSQFELTGRGGGGTPLPYPSLKQLGISYGAARYRMTMSPRAANVGTHGRGFLGNQGHWGLRYISRVSSSSSCVPVIEGESQADM